MVISSKVGVVLLTLSLVVDLGEAALGDSASLIVEALGA
jgi:hypothetical protein